MKTSNLNSLPKLVDLVQNRSNVLCESKRVYFRGPKIQSRCTTKAKSTHTLYTGTSLDGGFVWPLIHFANNLINKNNIVFMYISLKKCYYLKNVGRIFIHFYIWKNFAGHRMYIPNFAHTHHLRCDVLALALYTVYSTTCMVIVL